MRKNYFFKLLIAIAFCSLGLTSFAASTIYLAATGGDDGNDGSTSGLAVATLAQAMTLVDAGGTIIVSGMVSATSETTLSKNVTIQGTSNSTDGFTGGNSARFINNAGYNLTLSNLKLTSFAVTAGNGGVLLLSGGTVNISNVNFDNNKAQKGGAIYVAAGTITMDGCSLQNNDNTSISGSQGGAIYVLPTATASLNLNNTLIKNNKTLAEGGAIYYLDNAVTACTMKFTNCAIISNTTGGATLGGGAFINNATSGATVGITFINTTIYDNAAGGVSSGAMLVINLRTNSFIDFRNCTITGNKVSGTTAAGGAGIRVANTVHDPTNGGGKIKIYNSILENNYCPGAAINSTNYTTDFVWQSEGFTAGTNLIIENSMLGRPMQASNTKWSLATNSFPTSKYNYISVVNNDVRNSYLAKFGTFNTTYNFLPLQSGSFALGYGVTSHLTGLTPSITTDQIGNSRIASTCDAGAIEQSLRVIITSTSSASTPDSPIPVTITFNKSVTDFDINDITVGNGTKSNFSGSGTTYTLDVTPTNPGTVTADIAANVATESGGSGNIAATQFTRTYAPVGAPPTVIISSTTSSTTQTNPIPVTFTFSEAVTGFDINDITVGNGTKSNFAGSGTTYTVDITPIVQGSITIDVAADAAINGSSTGNTAATQLVRTYFKDIYLSATGNDANDGFTPGTAVLKFSTALGKAIAGQKIYVSGMVDFSTETLPTGVALNKNITIQGTSNATDGFDGKNQTRFFDIGNYIITLKNLKLKDGYSGNNHGGAISINTSSGSLNCENVIFDGNKTGMNAVTSNANRTGGAIYISNINGATFKNCIFSNNEASKTGAIYINNWATSSAIKFEGCAFVGNIVKESFGGSAIFILTTNDNNSISMINCTFAKNEVRSTANGGTIYVYKGSANTVTNIINCTVSENTTAGVDATGAGVYFKNSTSGDIYAGKLFIQNSIIEGNIAANNTFSDLSTSEAPTTTTLQINNSLIGKQGSSPVIPSGCFGATNQYNYLTSASTTNAYKGGLAPYNSTSNVYPLYAGSAAIGYGNSSYLTGLTPAVTIDQLGNIRTVGATNYAGAWESTPVATTTPAAPTSLVATAGDGKVSVAFTTSSTGGSLITNYKYSSDGTNFLACSPAKTTSPIVITGLTNGNAYTIKLKAVNENGDSPESNASNSVTPHESNNDIIISSATNISSLTLTPVSDIVVTSNVLTINQSTAINSMTIAPGAKVTVSGTNALTATSGITLQSNAGGTATLTDGYENPTITATVEQYLPQGRNWYVGSPVETNIATTANLTAAGAASVSYYSEAAGWQNNYTGSLAEGVGYVAVSSSGTNTNKISFSGKLNSGDVPVTLTRKSTGAYAGFNLIANPYPSYINPMAAINANTSLDGTIWYRTRKTASPFEYKFETVNTTSGIGTNAAGTGMVTGYIPPMQAFWVRTNADDQLFTFTNSMRDHARNVTVGEGTVPTTPLKAGQAANTAIVRIEVAGNGGSDEAVLYFDENASNGFDRYDSRKMFESATSSVPEIYSIVGREKLVINGLNAIAEDLEIPFGFNAKQTGDYVISSTGMKNPDSGTRIILRDKLNPNTEHELGDGSVYNFSSDICYGDDRFSILFKAAGTTTGLKENDKDDIRVFVNAANQITIIAPENCKYAVYNAAGVLIKSDTTNSNKHTLDISLSSGLYIVKAGNSSNRVIIK